MTEINNYNEESIEEISQIEGARFRPQSIGFESHNHIFIEQLANSVDEAREGYGKLIEITKYEDDSISVRDYGRSIPLDFNQKTQKYNWKTIFQTMWGGGKYSNNKEKANYKKSLGTNGAGNFGSASTSLFLEVWSYKGNECHNIRFEEGKIVKEFNKFEDNSPMGTLVHFKPDDKCYSENIIEDEFIENILLTQSIINGGIKFTYNNEKLKFKKEYYYENGIDDYIKEISNGQEFTDIYKFSGETYIESKPEDFEADYEIYFAFNNSINKLEYYHNSSFLSNGGLPEKVIKNVFTDVIDEYINKNNLYKKGEKIKFEDIVDSLILIFSSGSTTSIFSDQTKRSIKHNVLQKHIIDEFKQYLQILFTENKLEAEKIINQCLINMRANNNAETAKQNIKKKLSENKGSGLSKKIEGLQDCDMKHSLVDERILLIVEGVSPFSTVVDAIDSRIMGVYALMGRFINSLKSTIADVLNNKPAYGLIQAVGCGIEIPKDELKKYKGIETFVKENARYGNIGIICDADAWGSGIVLAMITFIYKFLPTYLKEGRVFVVKTPRFKISTKDTPYYAYNELEKDKIVKELTEKNIKNTVSIKKGLGEFSIDEFYNYVLSEEARKKCFKQIKWIDDENLIANNFDMFMGDDIQSRKNFIYQNIVTIDFEDLDV